MPETEEINVTMLFRILIVLLLALGTVEAQEESAESNPEVTLHTSMGDIRLKLYADKAPATVENFLQYARDGHYDNTTFHRVISYFMIQGGGYTVDHQLKPTREPVQNEATNGLSNERGTIAMARTNDPHSATSQFFINVELNAELNFTSTANSRAWGYTVFGRVTDGMDVVNEIRLVPTGAQDVPVEPVLIESVEIH
jgi:cyclophilin family peptidyl-prolyl cis-trans isomerase